MKQKNITNILNIKIKTESKAVILEKVKLLLKDGKQHYLITANPEIVLHSTNDLGYRNIINKADLTIADGVGLKLASYLTKNKITEVIKGVDFIKDLCKLAEHNNYSVFFLGAENGAARQTAEKIRSDFPAINIKGAESGGFVDENGVLQDEQILDKINQTNPDILFVALGCPKQEKFIANYLTTLNFVKLAITVGGSFDFLAGKVRRAPKFLQRIGLEWLFRLLIEPQRWLRIYNAVVKFPLLFIYWKIKVKPIYRQGVILFIVNGQNQVLIIKRKQTENDKVLNDYPLMEHWQLPQGGIAGDNVENAAKREAKEEVGINSVKVIEISSDVIKYDWPLKVQLFYHKLGQVQKIAYLKFDGKENEIKCDGKECEEYKWVKIDDLMSSVHDVRRENVKIALEKYNILHRHFNPIFFNFINKRAVIIF